MEKEGGDDEVMWTLQLKFNECVFCGSFSFVLLLFVVESFWEGEETWRERKRLFGEGRMDGERERERDGFSFFCLFVF